MQKIQWKSILLLIISLLLLAYVSGFLQPISGLILLFILPGYALTLALFPKSEIDVWERISLTLGLSISTCVVSVFTANYFLGIPITSGIVAIEILSLTGVFIIVYLLRGSGQVLRRGVSLSGSINHDTTRKKILSAFTILLILILSFNLVYRIHRDYPYPFHRDEWQHIADSVQIVEDESIELTDPYYIDNPPKTDLEMGFHVFLAEFYLLTGWDLVLFYRFLPAFFACISALTLFAFIHRTTGSFLAGLFSMLFFTGLKSNISILGPWFFVPLTMSFPLLYLIFHLLSRGLGEGSLPLLFSATITLLALALIHPSIASFAYMTIILYLVFIIFYSLAIATLYLLSGGEYLREKLNPLSRFPVQRILGVFMIFLIPFLSFLYFLRFLNRGSLVETLRYFITDFMVFGRLIPVEELYKPFFLYDVYGFVGVSMSVVGIFYVLVKKRGLILFAGISTALAVMVLYQLQGFTVLLFYERVVYCALLCLAPLSGMGLYVLTCFSRDVLEKFNAGRLISTLFTVSLVAFIFYGVFSSYYMYEDKIYRMIDDSDYRAMKWLEESRRWHNVVMARARISHTIYPVSRNYVVTSMLRGASPRMLDNREFFTSACEGRERILEKYDVDYVLVRFKIECDFLTEIYHVDDDYIYEVAGSSSESVNV